MDGDAPTALANLGRLLMFEAEQLAARVPDSKPVQIEKLEEAIRLLTHFLDVIPADHPDRAKAAKGRERVLERLKELRED